MAVEVLVPKLGLTMESGLIEEWLVSPGHCRHAWRSTDADVHRQGGGRG